MATYLDTIVARHREVAAADHRVLDHLISQAGSMAPTRGFRAALAGTNGLGVIAEVKRRSPSKGDLNAGLDPAEMARSYVSGGATALSVLTDEEHFGGSVDDLEAARVAVAVPVLRKDFTVSPNDVCDARLMGADCVLLIAAVLDDRELADFHQLGHELGLDVLIEIHDEADLERTSQIGANLIGVNQRDLVTFRVDHERAVRMASLLPSSAVRVAESGVRGPTDAAALAAAGYDAVLVGESIVTSGDPASAVAALRACGPRRRT